MNQDNQHLELLSIFHYVVGGLTALFSCFPLIHLGVGIAMLSGEFQGDHPPPRAFAWIFIMIASVIILTGWTLAVAIIIAGRKLKKRTGRTFCLVIAGLECMMMPFGTGLGVLSLIVLTKESVKELFSMPSPPGVTP